MIFFFSVVIICAACLGITVYQLLWTWLHKRNLEHHYAEMDRIFRRKR
jgi:hypothetical protein